MAFDPDVLVGGEGEPVQFVVVDHGFEMLPTQVRAGTSLMMENSSSSAEFHTVIVYRLDDDDSRSAEELAALPYEPDGEDVAGYGVLEGLGGTAIGTLSAPPAAPGRQIGTGASMLALDEPGRYAIFDTLPVGVDIGTAIGAENSGDFSALQEGPFHYQQGEVAIVEVVDETAQAGGSESEQPFEEVLFYGDFEQEVLLFAGGTTEDICNDIGPSATAQVSANQDGSIEITVDIPDSPIFLYSSPLGGPDLIDATCEALMDDDPDTVPLEPYATGEGDVRARIEVAADGTEHVVNSTEGTASSPDGTTWRVEGFADLQVVDGVPMGDPAEFQGLTIQME